jgi:dTDP-4-dehydrorhamnose 3,5-epimerase
MNVSKCKLDGIFLIEPKAFPDERGFFLESFEIERYKNIGITENFVQENHSRSKKNVLRGLHFTREKQQSQILTVIQGKIFDVVVDIRKTSPTFGEWFGAELSDKGVRQIYMPHGFAHGFFVLSDWADLHYKVSNRYDLYDEGGLNFADPDIGIKWPSLKPNVNKRDANYPFLKDLFS